MTYLIVPLGFIFILGSAVVLHEFGHFIVAKLFRIRVETFSVGFGPRLFGRKWGDTDYRVSAIPLGGYVKLGGDESNSPIEGAGAENIPAEEMFNLRPRWQRISIALPGVVQGKDQEVPLTFVPTSHIENGDAAGSVDFVPDYGGLPVIAADVTPASPAAETGLQEEIGRAHV